MEVQVNSSKRHRRLILQLVCAVVVLVAGVALIITSFFVPPMGEIHPSVLGAYGESLTFVGALFGIDYRYRTKQHNDEVFHDK